MPIKLKLKPAHELQPKIKRPPMVAVVKRFLDGPVLAAIADRQETPHYRCVNVEIPYEAYSDLPLFYQLCAEALQPLGYKSEESHDGANICNTLCVTWNKSKKA